MICPHCNGYGVNGPGYVPIDDKICVLCDGRGRVPLLTSALYGWWDSRARAKMAQIARRLKRALSGRL